MPASDKPQVKADPVGNVPEQTGLALSTDGKGEIHLEPSTAAEPVLSTVQVVSSLNVLHDANTFTPVGEAHLPGVDIVNAEPAQTAVKPEIVAQTEPAVKPEIVAQAEPAVAAEVGSSASAGMTLDRLMSMTAQKADHAETAATVQSQEQGSLERLIAVVEKANDGKPVLGTGEGFESRALFPGDSTVSKVSEKVVRGILDDQKKVEGVKTEEPTTIYVEPAAGDLKPGHDAAGVRTGAAASPVELPRTITLLEQAAESFHHPVATERSAESNKRLAEIVKEIPVVRAPVENTGAGEGFQSRSLFPGDSAVSLVTTANMDKILNRQPEAPAGETQIYVKPAKDDLAVSTVPAVHVAVPAGSEAHGDSQHENSLPPVDRAPVVASLARLATAIGEEARPEAVQPKKVESASPVEPLKNVLVGSTVRAPENQIVEGQGFQDRSLFPGDSHESVVSQGQIEKIVNRMALPVVRKAESTAPVVVASAESAQAPLASLPAARPAEGDKAPAVREVVVSDTPMYVASAPTDLGPGIGARADKPASDGKLPVVASTGSGASDNKLPVITPAASHADDSPIARAVAVIVDNTPVTHADASPLPSVVSTGRTIAGVEVVAAKPEAIGTGL
ncbi:MAG: hypothetical protein KC777_13475, partial [Cyanobacteria bacterium HKST-UBA02]|nr:hypothetical protein [Cyanobacteria bacterium HKST-UBA02]